MSLGIVYDTANKLSKELLKRSKDMGNLFIFGTRKN